MMAKRSDKRQRRGGAPDKASGDRGEPAARAAVPTDGSLAVTAVRPTARDPGRVTVRVGRRVVATLSAARAQAVGAVVGAAWTAALAARVAEAAGSDKAYRQALHRLGRRAMSRRELDRKLERLGHPPAARAEALDRLTELGYLDDAAYGRSLLRELTLRKPAGPRLLRQKLYQKGLERGLIDALLAERDDGEAQVEQAVKLARKRVRSLARLEPAARRRRLYGQLARRGFEPGAIEAAMRAVAGALGSGPGEGADEGNGWPG